MWKHLLTHVVMLSQPDHTIHTWPNQPDAVLMGVAGSVLNMLSLPLLGLSYDRGYLSERSN